MFYGGEACGWKWEGTYFENPMGFLRNTNTSMRLVFVFLKPFLPSEYECCCTSHLFLVLLHKGWLLP